ncbi:hypothetical protein J7J90_04180 [Candidatus Micrarchaeota archaeon]|nr:hypothetical protein [Candidatus Micrarchaeota archaeon]
MTILKTKEIAMRNKIKSLNSNIIHLTRFVSEFEVLKLPPEKRKDVLIRVPEEYAIYPHNFAVKSEFLIGKGIPKILTIDDLLLNADEEYNGLIIFTADEGNYLAALLMFWEVAKYNDNPDQFLDFFKKTHNISKDKILESKIEKVILWIKRMNSMIKDHFEKEGNYEDLIKDVGFSYVARVWVRNIITFLNLFNPKIELPEDVKRTGIDNLFGHRIKQSFLSIHHINKEHESNQSP